MKGPRWHRDEFAELLTALKMRNVMLAEVVAQAVSRQIRSMLATTSAAAATSERDTETGTATRRRRKANVAADGSSSATLEAK